MDPKFEDLKIGKESLPEYFHKHGIKTLKEGDLVVSCHGNTELSVRAAQEMQKLIESGHRVLSFQWGGKYFAKPSLEAANASAVPVISVPLNGQFGGLDAFLAGYIPTGKPVVAGSGVENYAAAANVAVDILTSQYEGVHVVHCTDKLRKRLDKFGIKVSDKADLPSYLNLGCMAVQNELPDAAMIQAFDNAVGGGLFAIAKTKKPEAAIALMNVCSGLKQSLYVGGDENLAFFAARAMSAYNPQLREKLATVAKDKADSYDKRDINPESFA